MTSGQRNGLLALVACGAFVFAGVMLYRNAGGSSGGLPNKIHVDGVCLSCKAESSATFAVTDHDPFSCPKCNAKSFYPWYMCFDCSSRFVPNLSRPVPGEPMRIPIAPRCPHCSGDNLGGYSPEIVKKEELKPDQPLPKWEP